MLNQFFRYALTGVLAAFALCVQAAPSPDQTLRISFRDYQIQTHVYRDLDAIKPQRVVIYSHGRSGTAEGRQKVDLPPANVVQFWRARGFALVAAVRPGYGATGGGDREVHGSRWVSDDQGVRCVGVSDFANVGAKAAQAIEAVTAWVRDQAWADGQSMVLVGQSVGGLGTIALAAQSPSGVVLAINFAGGTGGYPEKSEGRSCMPDKLAAVYGNYGAATKIPTLWLYAKGDKYWGDDAPLAWHAAFAAGGSKTQLFQSPALLNTDGHNLQTRGLAFWQPLVEQFLREHGLMP